MVVTQPKSSTRVGTELFNRYMLPKVALVLISIASFAGVFLTMTLHGGNTVAVALRWTHLASMAILCGGMMWWLFFVRPADEGEDREPVERFALEQVRRFRAGASFALGVAVVTSPHLAWFAHWSERSSTARALFGANVVGFAVAAFLTAIVLRQALHGGQAAEKRWVNRRVGAAFGFVVAYLVATATLDAELTFPGWWWARLLRSAHVLAFCLWMGGAAWNIFVAGPAALKTLSMPVVVSAALQLERFRWVVRFVLPTLILSGLAQALPYSGSRWEWLVETAGGHIVLLKVGLITALVAIFITCPLWRACSPIRGICDLNDLQSRPEALPARRLDNRGKSCAGFVHIQRALESLEAGEVLEVLSTDPISWWELPAWLEKHGYELLERERRGRFLGRHYRFLITLGEGGAQGARPR